MKKQSTYVARLNHYLKKHITVLHKSDLTNRWPKQNGLRNHQHRKKKSTYATRLKNKGIGSLAALQLSSIFFSHFEAEKCSKPCVFHIFHLWEAFSKLHHCVLRGPIQNSDNTFSLRRNMFSQSHAGQQFLFTSTSIIHIYIHIYLSDYLSIYPNILMYPCCARYVQGMQKETKEEHVES